MSLVELAAAGGQRLAQGVLARRTHLDQLRTRRDDRAPRRRCLVGIVVGDHRRLGEPLERGLEPHDLGRRDRLAPAHGAQLGRFLGLRLRRSLDPGPHGRRNRAAFDLDAHGVVDHGERQTRDAHRAGCVRGRDPAHAPHRVDIDP